MTREKTTEKAKAWEDEISPEATQLYIRQMLEELSTIAQSSGLRDIAYLLKATAAASQVDFHLETNA